MGHDIPFLRLEQVKGQGAVTHHPRELTVVLHWEDAFDDLGKGPESIFLFIWIYIYLVV